MFAPSFSLSLQLSSETKKRKRIKKKNQGKQNILERLAASVLHTSQASKKKKKILLFSVFAHALGTAYAATLLPNAISIIRLTVQGFI